MSVTVKRRPVTRLCKRSSSGCRFSLQSPGIADGPGYLQHEREKLIWKQEILNISSKGVESTCPYHRDVVLAVDVFLDGFEVVVLTVAPDFVEG